MMGTLPEIAGSAAPFQIARATWQDLNDLRRLEEICFLEDSWPFWDLIAVLTLPKIIRLKALIDGNMVGFIAGDPQPREKLGWVSTLGILPQYRRKGIAEALLENCEAELGFPRIRLSVRRSNEPALHLYKKAGYQMFDVWRNYYHNGEDALVLEKRR
ncbi:MAG: GNAT family N-acetyltransferase [Anaerolineaceae bacterium]|nr:GNAT family N-acetyltransferase [Anaerolineaceae bacterium]